MSAPITNLDNKPKYEVADIFRQYGSEYVRSHRLPGRTHRLIFDLMYCRTALLGGHERKCTACDFKQNQYNSCCNRHCPKCQALKKARWLSARKSELLPIGYFHNVFTLPHELNSLILYNKKLLLDLLFKAAKETLLAFGKDPKWKLGGQLGFIAILHTWDQLMNAHYHLHCIIPSGAFSREQSKWFHTQKRKCKKTGIMKDFLFRIEPLSDTFKGKYLYYLRQAFEGGDLRFPKCMNHLKPKRNFDQFCWSLRQKNWVVYSKEPFKGPEYVFEYLGRYVHRVAISNDRIRSIDDGTVTITYKDREDNYTTKEHKLSARLFMDRFLLHELPKGFMKIRHYGFLSNRYRKENLKRIRGILQVPHPKKQQKKGVLELMFELTLKNIGLCPTCKKGRMMLSVPLPSPSDIKTNWLRYYPFYVPIQRE